MAGQKFNVRVRLSTLSAELYNPLNSKDQNMGTLLGWKNYEYNGYLRPLQVLTRSFIVGLGFGS